MDSSVTSDGDVKLEPSEVSSPRSAMDDGSCSGDESDDYKEVVWDADTEICLFESIAKYPPTGVNRYFSILNSSILLQKRLNKRITPQQTLEHLNSLYNLEALDDSDMDSQVVDFSLPPEYASMLEERAKERDAEDASGPPSKRKRVEKEKDTEKEKEEKETEKDKEKDEEKKASKTEGSVPSPASPTSSKYATFSEFIQGALAALGGQADLQTLYNYVAEHSTEVDKKYASRFENNTGKAAVGYKSNVRSTLHNNQCFVKQSNGLWTVNPSASGSKKR